MEKRACMEEGEKREVEVEGRSTRRDRKGEKGRREKGKVERMEEAE